MGVPGFYSWLARRYPLVLHNLKKGEVPGIDCFYLDMNGIIYKCSKDEGTVFKDLLLQRNIQEIFSLIFNYIDEMVNLVEPKKVLYLFLDGPCPRAKQNQQRTRRFQSSQSWKDLNESLRNCGFLSEGETMKNNSISTGTEFMDDLNKQLHFYICKKFEQDPRWANLEVFFSGSNVPGEGEHKIINFMHQYCASNDYDPQTTHCIYGADADLIQLGLSTHIKYVSILREEMKFSPPISRAAKRDRENYTFQMIYLNIVREYMELEYKMLWKKVKHLQYNIERVIDDFLLICCFIGNDFLPRLYCFNIREGQFEILIQIYKDYLIEADEYLNNNGVVNWIGLEKLINKIAEVELEFIGDKATDFVKEYKRRIRHQSDKDDEIEDGSGQSRKKKNNSDDEVPDDEDDDFEDEDDDDYNDDLCDDNDESDEDKNNAKNEITFKEKFEKNQEEKKKTEDKVIKKEKEFMEDLQENFKKDKFLGKSFYYQQKLNLNFTNLEDIKTLDLLITKYLEGLQFVLLYYYQGCPSWSWYFPFYYAPMTSDISLFLKYKAQHLSSEIKFQLSAPYPPMKQLMCIINPQNANLLPAAFARLLTDPQSKLRSPVDYYPDKFTIDPYGGVFSHEYIVVLPFMDEKLIEEAYQSIDQKKELSQSERQRNEFGRNIKYKYDLSFPKINVKSTLPNYYKDFDVSLKIETFDIGKIYSPPRNPTAVHLSRFPTIHAKNIIGCEIDKAEKGLQMKIRQQPELSENDFNKPKGKPVFEYYCKYPNCEKVVVTGLLTSDDFFNIWKNKNISILQNMDYSPESHHSFYLKVKDDLSNLFYKKAGIIYNHASPVIAILMKYTEGRRTLKGTIIENKDKYEEFFCPLDLIMKEPKIEKVIQIAKCDQIDKEFPIGCKVVIAEKGKYDGFTGIVKGYVKGKLAQELNVQIQTQPIYLTDQQLRNYSKDDEPFVSLKYLCFKMQITQDVLLDLLDSLPIKVDPTLTSSSKLPKMLDVGLNAIRRHINEVVPELARINEAQDNLQGREKYLQFKDLEISPCLVKLIVEYYNTFPRVFAKVATLQVLKRKDKGATLSANLIFTKEGEDPNIELVKLYIWLMKKKESQYQSATVASKVMTSHKIATLVKFQDEFASSKLNLPQKDQVTVQVDANNAIPAIYTSKQYIYFKEQPFYHEIGDQVIYIGTYNTKNAPFGIQGTVVGIMDDKFEVVFIKPFIGGTNLGGRCPSQRGLVVQFDEIYNLQGWNNFLEKRDNSKEMTLGWNGWVDEYKPKFREAIKNDKELQTNKQINETSNLLGSLVQQVEAIPVAPQKQQDSKVVAIIKKGDGKAANATDTISEVTGNPSTQQTSKVTIGPAPTTVTNPPTATQNIEKIEPQKNVVPQQKKETQKSKPQKEQVVYVKKTETVQNVQQEEQKEQQKVEQKSPVKQKPQEQPKTEQKSVVEPKYVDISEIEKQIEEKKEPEKANPQILDVSELEKQSQKHKVEQSNQPQVYDVEEIEKRMIQEQLGHIKHQNQKEPEIKNVAEFEKEMLKKSEQEAKGVVLEDNVNYKKQEETQDKQEGGRKAKKLKMKEVVGFNPDQHSVQANQREKNTEDKRMKRNEKRQQQQEQNLQYQQYQQYYQYLYLWQQQFIQQRKTDMEQIKRKQEDERLQKNLAQLTNPNSNNEAANEDLLLMQNQLEQNVSGNPQEIKIFDSSQIEHQLSQNAQQPVSIAEKKQDEEKYNTGNIGDLNAEDLETFEELERQYLSQFEN